jgi:hypothetical protein
MNRLDNDWTEEDCDAAVEGFAALKRRLTDATELLNEARDAIDEARYPVWWEKWRSFLANAQKPSEHIDIADGLDDDPAEPIVLRNQAGEVIDGQTEVPGPAPNRLVDPRSVCGVLQRFLNDKSLTINWLRAELAKEGVIRRTDHERAVLAAWAEVPKETLYMWATHPSEHVRHVCRTEIARRGAR